MMTLVEYACWFITLCLFWGGLKYTWAKYILKEDVLTLNEKVDKYGPFFKVG